MSEHSLRDVGTRALLYHRMFHLTPETDPRWGEMNPAQLLAHLADAMRLAFKEGEVITADEDAQFAKQRREWIHEWPWPEGKAKAPPEGFLTAPTDWESDRASLHELIERFAQTSETDLAGSHPLFGTMTPEDWDVLMYKHLHHHLRQFGV